MPHESFAAYCRRDGAALLHLASRLAGSAADGQDLAQDVLERLARSWERMATLDNVDSYARRAVVNLSRTRHRRRQTERVALERLAAAVVAATPAAANAGSANEAIDDDVWEQVRRLPGRQPAVIALVVLEGRSHTEVAEILGVSAANARQCYSRAVRRLRQQVPARA